MILQKKKKKNSCVLQSTLVTLELELALNVLTSYYMIGPLGA